LETSSSRAKQLFSRIKIISTSAVAVSLITISIVGFSSVSSASTTNLSAKQRAEISNETIASALIGRDPLISEAYIANDLETSGSAPWACLGRVFGSFVSSSYANEELLAPGIESLYAESSGWSQAVIDMTSQAFVDAIDLANPYSFTTADVVKVAEYTAQEITWKALGSVGQNLFNNLAQSYLVNTMTSEFGASLTRAAIAASQHVNGTLTGDIVAAMESAPGSSEQNYIAISACNLPNQGY
jgi:hypothetical protein